MIQVTPGVGWSPGGREIRQPQGSGVFEEPGTRSTTSVDQFHEFIPDLAFEQQPQAQSAELHAGDTATMVGKQKLPTLPRRTMTEVYQSALGTLTCDERMRSNMGRPEDGKPDFMPLPVPHGGYGGGGSCRGHQSLGRLEKPASWYGETSDLQSLAVKNLSDLVHRQGLWKVEDVSVNFVRISLKESPLITWVKR